MEIEREAIELHRKFKGKLEIRCKVPLQNKWDLSLVYTPGVAEISTRIFNNPEEAYELTIKANSVAVISDGSAVLGLGNIGPLGALPVMEGKAILFKKFAGIDAFPICLNTQDADKIIETIYFLSPTFGGINLEDISSPRCFYIERKLKEILDIPIFHDDQHGTAVVTLAALLNALKVRGSKINEIEIVILGAGAAGLAIAEILIHLGVKEIKIVDKHGIIYPGRKEGMNEEKERLAQITNPEGEKGNLDDAIKGKDVFIGVSQGKLLTKEHIKKMKKNPIIFAMANPIPEIMPEEAKEAGVRIIGTGRSDFPNQINNLLAFPGIFRGALTVRAKEINLDMKISASYAIAELVDNPEENYLVPSPLDRRVVPEVALRVAESAINSKIARIVKSKEELKREILEAIGGLHEEL